MYSVSELIIKVYRVVDPLIFYLIMHAIRAIILVLDTLVLQPFFKTSLIRGSKQEQYQATRNNLEAHVMSVKWRAWLGIGIPMSEDHFLYVHESYQSLDYIADRETVSLFSFDERNAYFVETEPGTSVFETKEYPFTCLSQFFEARKLIVVSHESLHRLGERLGDPEVKVTAVNMTARCGSTLLTQMVSRVPNTRAMSEPWCFVSLNMLVNSGQLYASDHEKLIRSGMRALCKVEPGSGVERIFIKFTNSNAAQFELFHRLFPRFTFLFNTRQLVPSLKSYKKVISKNVRNSLVDRLGIQWRIFYKLVPFPYDEPELLDGFVRKYNTWFRKLKSLEGVALMMSGIHLGFVKHKEIYSKVIFYEDLVDDTEKVIGEVLDLAGCPRDALPLALAAFKHDSQKDILTPRGEIKSLDVTPDEKGQVDRMFKAYKIPLYCDMSLDEFKSFFSLKA